MVIFRHDAELRQGHEVEHRDILGQLQTVGAGDRNTLTPQGADHRIEEIAALAHEDKYVAGVNRALLRRQPAPTDP